MKKIVAISFLIISVLQLKAQNEEAGLKAMKAENFTTAKNIFRSILQANDKEAKNFFNFGEALFANEQYDSAKMMYQAGLALDARSKPNLVGLGKCLLNAGLKDEAKKNFDRALSLASSKDVNTSILVGLAYISTEKNNDADAAINLLKAKLEDNAKNAALYEALGDAYISKNQGGDAVTNYEFAVQNDPARATALTKIGEIYVRAKSYEEAINYFNKAFQVDANFPPAHRELSDLYFRAGKFDKAKIEFDEYMKYADQTIETKIKNAKILYKSERYDDAISTINEVLKQQPNNFIMWRLLAYSNFKTGKTADAETQFQQYFQKVQPTDIIATDYQNYASTLSKNGKDSLSIIEMQKAMAADNTIDFSADILAAYFKQKKYDNVLSEYEKLVQKNFVIKDPNTFYSAARSYYNLSRFKDADTTYAQVNRVSPKYANAWLGRARCNAIIDSSHATYAAKPFYDKFLELVKIDDAKNKSNIIEAYHYLADYSFNKENDKDKAKDYCQKILSLDPDDQQAKEVLKGFEQKH
jgi:tetratricopeptide (TPR) repeat protein